MAEPRTSEYILRVRCKTTKIANFRLKLRAETIHTSSDPRLSDRVYLNIGLCCECFGESVVFRRFFRNPFVNGHHIKASPCSAVSVCRRAFTMHVKTPVGSFLLHSRPPPPPVPFYRRQRPSSPCLGGKICCPLMAFLLLLSSDSESILRATLPTCTLRDCRGVGRVGAKWPLPPRWSDYLLCAIAAILIRRPFPLWWRWMRYQLNSCDWFCTFRTRLLINIAAFLMWLA